MEPKNERPSLYRFIEQTAKVLRKAAIPKSTKKRFYKKSVSVSNKISQIAKLLRSETNKKEK